MRYFLKSTIAAAGALLMSSAAPAAVSGVYITEWMYSGTGGEFVELTNLSGAAVDFSGWSYDDDSRTPLAFDLSGFGVVASGESVVFTEDDADTFRTDWGLNATVKVLGGVTNNIGRNDEINIYDGAFNPVDQLTYGDGDFPGSIRTKDASGNPSSLAALGANDPLQWVLAVDGDGYGSYASLKGDLGNPGSFVSAVPLPAALWLLAPALLGLVGVRRKA